MKPTLVTGANGHLGNNICRLLVERGEPVRAMIRASADPAPLLGLDIEIVRGDIMDTASTQAATDGCGRVYHTAAAFVMWSKDPEREVIQPCRDGTRIVMEAAAKAGVDKVVYTSTTATIGFSADPSTPTDETHRNTNPHTAYVRGKIAAEEEAFAVAERTRLAMSSIHPGLILGPRFFKVSESVKQIADFVNQGAPAYFDGGFDIVDVEDVARCSVLAMEKGGDRERYIASGEHVTIKQAFETLAELTGLKAPTLRLPTPVLRVAAGLMELGSKITGGRPMLDRGQVDEFAGKFSYFDSGKAVRELGYTYRPARDVLARTVGWLVERGFVEEKRKEVLHLHSSVRGAY